MKQIIILTVITFSLFNCKAQNPIISIDNLGWKNIDNAYYKDINNELNNFEGTWLYTNGNTSLKIILNKYTMLYNGKYYEDEIIGGYQYIENGVEIVNTLSDASNPSLGISASIDGNSISSNCKYLPVDDCTDGEKSLNLSIDDPNTSGHIGDLIIFKRIISGQEAIKINIVLTYLGDEPNDGNLPSPTIPWQMQNIVLIKQ